MTTILRRESWSKEVDWGQSGFVVEVLEGEKVNVMPTVVKELGLAGKAYSDIVADGKDYFVMQFDYADVAEALQAQWWTYEGVLNASSA